MRPEERLYQFGPFRLDPAERLLLHEGQAVPLSAKAFDLLVLLTENSGHLLEKDDLMKKIWPETVVEEVNLAHNISIIRRALASRGDVHEYVETVPKRGYRFVAPVQNVAKSVGHAATEIASREGEDAKTVASTRRSRVALVGAGLAATAVTLLVSVDPGEGGPCLLGGPPPPVRTIAVLPLQNLSGDAAQDYIADGMTEALTTDLARMESLQVISHTSAIQYKTAKKALPAIARELKVDAVVEGSVQRSGSHVRITAQLVRASDDRHLWADTYERDFRDVLALQDEVASDIAKQIESRLGGPKPAPVPKAQAVNPEAYENYLRANYYLDSLDLQKSIDYYRQAIKLDPNYAPAYAHMAQAYSFLAFFGEISPSEGWGKVKEAASLAIQKDERSPAGHGALALARLHYDWDFRGAELEFKRALELNPSDADVRHDHAHYLMAMGRAAESEAESARAVELDPVGENLNDCLCWHSFAARDYDEAVRLAAKFLKSHPDDVWARSVLGWAYEQKRMPEQAITELKRAVELTKSARATPAYPGDPFFVAALGHAYAIAGNRREAEKVLQTLSDRAKKSYVSPFDLALIYAALGEKDKAFALLDKAVAERSTFLVYSKWEPRLDPLRSDPRFQELLRRVGLAAS